MTWAQQHELKQRQLKYTNKMVENQMKINQKLLLALNKTSQKYPAEKISNNGSTSLEILNTNNYIQNLGLANTAFFPFMIASNSARYFTTVSSTVSSTAAKQDGFMPSPSLSNTSINPWYITGFADGEGCFSFSIRDSQTSKSGRQVILEFNLVAADNPANYKQLELIRDYFGLGKIYNIPAVGSKEAKIEYRVTALQDCIKIRDHFLKYPLLTYKLVHFQLWCEVIEIMLNKEHLNLKGLMKIIALKLYSPKGLSESLKMAFPNYLSFIKSCPEYKPNLDNLNIHWLSGFINADGHFSVRVVKSPKSKLGFGTNPLIKISQHMNSLIVMEKIQNFLGCGQISKDKQSNNYNFTIHSIKDVNLFIARFKEAKLLGAKALDYTDFCKIIEIMNKGLHLTKDGLSQIIQINSNVNSRRTIF